jgi:hypothetical protein
MARICGTLTPGKKMLDTFQGRSEAHVGQLGGESAMPNIHCQEKNHRHQPDTNEEQKICLHFLLLVFGFLQNDPLPHIENNTNCTGQILDEVHRTEFRKGIPEVKMMIGKSKTKIGNSRSKTNPYARCNTIPTIQQGADICCR